MEKILHSPEEIIEPKVILHFLRHSISEKVPGKNDKEIRLSSEGRTLAAKKFEEPINLRFAHVTGSPRVRTQETGAIAATGNPETKPEDLGMSKVRVHEGLDFFIDKKSAYGERAYGERAKGTLLSFFVHEGDVLAKETGDDASSTYSSMARNIAEIVFNNYKVAIRGASILEQSQNPENKQNDFERVLATHAIIQECFLLKVVEKTRGVSERDQLLSLIGGDGFDNIEGFDVILSKENDEEKIRVTYKKGDYVFDEIVPVSVIEEIIEEGK